MTEAAESKRNMPVRSVLLSGASGCMGRQLAAELARREVPVLRLVRREPKAPEELRWWPGAGSGTGGGWVAEPERLEGVGAAVHLSGASIAGRRWTAAWKREMWSSRVESTRRLSETLAGLRQRPRVLVCASAIGFYGDRGDAVLDEDAAGGTGFFPELCAAWEGATRAAVEAGIRVVHLRLGVVLSRADGALARMLPVFRAGLGGRLGDGRQWMSWIGEEDAVRAFLWAMEQETLRGAVNAVAPEPVTNREFTGKLARQLRRPAWLPAPGFALRLALGEMADAALLASTRVLPRRLEQSGFVFQQARLEDALQAVVGRRS